MNFLNLYGKNELAGVFNFFLIFLIDNHPVLEVPKTTSRFGNLFTRRTHRTQHVVILTAVIYYRERIQSKVSKGKRCVGQNRNQALILSQWSHTECT